MSLKKSLIIFLFLIIFYPSLSFTDSTIPCFFLCSSKGCGNQVAYCSFCWSWTSECGWFSCPVYSYCPSYKVTLTCWCDTNPSIITYSCECSKACGAQCEFDTDCQPGTWETDPTNPCRERREIKKCSSSNCSCVGSGTYEYRNKPDCTSCSRSPECSGTNRCGTVAGDTRYYNPHCKNGSCVFQSSENCRCDATDSDGGKNYTTKGTCTDYNGCSNGSCQSSSYTDYCLSSTVLREYYVSGSGDSAICSYTDYDCQQLGSGYTCSGGKCVASTVTPSCSGSVSLTLNPSSVSAGGSVTPSASGLSNCSNKTIYFKKDSCSGSQVSSCNTGSGGTGCTGYPFTAPSTAGIYAYYACVDKNGDGDFLDSGEQDSKTLTVTSGYCSDYCDGYKLVDNNSDCRKNDVCGTKSNRYTGGECGLCPFNTSDCSNKYFGDNEIPSGVSCDVPITMNASGDVYLKGVMRIKSGGTLQIPAGKKIIIQGGEIRMEGGVILYPG